MAKRQPCNYPGQWNSGFIGDCSQHLKLGECPAVSGIKITYGGAPYQFPPVAIISGDSNGGSYATGFFAYGLLDSAGHVTGLNIVLSGWHFVVSPSIVFSGVFLTGIGGSATQCANKVWNDTGCMCSGSGLIYGYPIYQNTTLVPPQCSPVYSDPNWALQLPNLPICTAANLANISTDNFGVCKAGDEARCKTSWASGWVGDCDDGTWQKTNNYCSIHGGRATPARCEGAWYGGGSVSNCGARVAQTFTPTNTYLDVGSCKKRGYKNVVALKSWHGEPPLIGNTAPMPCFNCATGDAPYTQKYLCSAGTWSYTLTADKLWSDNTPVSNPTVIAANGTTTACVGRLDGKLVVNESFFCNTTNADAEYPRNFDGYDRCADTIYGFPRTGWNDSPWNYCNNSDTSVGNQINQTSYCVKTTASVSAAGYTFTQEITSFSYVANLDAGIIFDQSYAYSVESVTVSLSNPYTYQQLNSDAKDLLDAWNLLDDVQYPWKTTQDELLMPKVTRCEEPPTSPYGASVPIASCPAQPVCTYSYNSSNGSVVWDDCHPRQGLWPDLSGRSIYHVSCNFNTGNVCIAGCNNDGAIVGGPAPTGYLGMVDFARENWQTLCCDCDCQESNTQLIQSFGNVSPYYHMTQWPDDRERNLMYFGAFAFLNNTADVYSTCGGGTLPLIPNDVLVVGKYAEIVQMDKPSFIYRTPCGIGASPEITLQNQSDSSLNSWSNTNYASQCDQTCHCQTITVPDNVGSHSCYYCDSQSSTTKRWPYQSGTTYICGNTGLIVSGNITTSTGTLVLNATFTGTTGDYINVFLDYGGGNYSAATYPITATVSPSGLVITGSFVPTTSVSGWIDFPNTNDWFDNLPKGDFVVRNWNYATFAGSPAPTVRSDPFLTSISATQYCLPWHSCEPAIVVVGPSGGMEVANSSNRNAQVIQMPYLIPRPCGARMHYIPQQWMTDPTWNKPSMPCCLVSGIDRPICQPPPDSNDIGPASITHRWEEDDGSCRGLETEYLFSLGGGMSIIYHHHYPIRPFVEARISWLSSYSLPLGNCNMVNDALTSVSGCFTNSQLDGLTNNQYNALISTYGGQMCAVCSAPNNNATYWGQFAPWKVSANQEGCLREAGLI